MGGGLCNACLRPGADLHTGLCSYCLVDLPPYFRKQAEARAISAALIRQALIDGEKMGGIRWTEQKYQEFLRRQQAPSEREERKPKAGSNKPPNGTDPRTLTFEIPLELSPLPNGKGGLKRMHWAAERKLRRALADALRAQIPNCSGTPFAQAKVEVVRYTARQPDKDNLYASLKPLLDAMQLASKRHPYGCYIITDDSSDHIELTARWEKASPKHGKVIVLVTPKP